MINLILINFCIGLCLYSIIQVGLNGFLARNPRVHRIVELTPFKKVVGTIGGYLICCIPIFNVISIFSLITLPTYKVDECFMQALSKSDNWSIF
jgi:hypothetical protein